ncbi:MAG: alcohol dehydrogenase, partial [Tropicimonas sp.]
MTDLTQPIELQFPPSIRFGTDALSHLASWAAEKGYRRPFVVADAVNAGRLDLLGLGNPACFGDVVPEPDLNNLSAAVAAAQGA